MWNANSLLEDFELRSPNPFSTPITITHRAPPKYVICSTYSLHYVFLSVASCSHLCSCSLSFVSMSRYSKFFSIGKMNNNATTCSRVHDLSITLTTLSLDHPLLPMVNQWTEIESSTAPVGDFWLTNLFPISRVIQSLELFTNENHILKLTSGSSYINQTRWTKHFRHCFELFYYTC